jgi:hypothetical protein
MVAGGQDSEAPLGSGLQGWGDHQSQHQCSQARQDQACQVKIIFTLHQNCLFMVVWRPIFIIVLLVIELWRELNCVKIPQGDAKKSANRFDIYAPKVE